MGVVRKRTRALQSRRKVACVAYAEIELNSKLFYLKYIPKVLQGFLKVNRVENQIITIIGCCVSGIIKSAMFTECWTP